MVVIDNKLMETDHGEDIVSQVSSKVRSDKTGQTVQSKSSIILITT